MIDQSRPWYVDDSHARVFLSTKTGTYSQVVDKVLVKPYIVSKSEGGHKIKENTCAYVDNFVDKTWKTGELSTKWAFALWLTTA